MPVITHPTAGCPVCGEPYSVEVEYDFDGGTIIKDWWMPNCMDERKECYNKRQHITCEDLIEQILVGSKIPVK